MIQHTLNDHDCRPCRVRVPRRAHHYCRLCVLVRRVLPIMIVGRAALVCRAVPIRLFGCAVFVCRAVPASSVPAGLAVEPQAPLFLRV